MRREHLALAERDDAERATKPALFAVPSPAEARRRLATLTPRQREVVDGVVRGLRNVEIAARLGMQAATVAAHRDTINIRLGTHGTHDVIALSRAAAEAGGDEASQGPGVAGKEPTALEKLARLTAREREVFNVMAQGATYRGAAERLGCSHKTAEAHARRIRTKTGAVVAGYAALAAAARAERKAAKVAQEGTVS
jgi:DNA-binding CsgD family transcriptional regulator